MNSEYVEEGFTGEKDRGGAVYTYRYSYVERNTDCRGHILYTPVRDLVIEHKQEDGTVVKIVIDYDTVPTLLKCIDRYIPDAKDRL